MKNSEKRIQTSTRRHGKFTKKGTGVNSSCQVKKRKKGRSASQTVFHGLKQKEQNGNLYVTFLLHFVICTTKI
jgi:hypothetical protein